MLPFESGVSEEAAGQQRRFTVSFYLTAMLFILFDIEIVFLYPLAVQLDALGWFGLGRVPRLRRDPRASPTSTSGGRERSNGSEARKLPLDQRPPAREGRPPVRARALARPRARASSSRRSTEIEDALGLTTVEKAVAWAQSNSMWPDTFGLACCAIEMMSIVSSRYDIARFGMERFSSSPRQADLLIVSGRVTHKMAAPLRQVYDQMLEPKWVIAMGACASSGGMFNNYTILQGVDKIVPVDIHVPGCPPRPGGADGGHRPAAREDPRPACRPRTRSAGSRE